MKRAGLIAMTLVFLTLNAEASNFYLTIGGGGVLSNKNGNFTENSNFFIVSPTVVGTSTILLSPVNWQNKFGTGYAGNIALGYQISPNWRSDLEFLYQNLSRDIGGTYDWLELNTATGAFVASSINNPITGVSTRARLYTFLLNQYYDCKNSTKWTPYVGIGIGIAHLSSGSTTATSLIAVNNLTTLAPEKNIVSQNSPSFASNAAAWQIKAGVSYAYSAKTSFMLQYRLFGTAQFKANSSSIVENPNTAVPLVYFIPDHNINGLLTNVLDFNVRFNL